MKTTLKSIITAAFALAAAFITTSALAATPVAVWEGDLADNSTKNNIKLTLNGNSVENGVVTINQEKGVQFYNNNFNSHAITVIFKYSNLDTSSTTSRSLVTVGGGNNSTATGSSDDYLGLYALNGSTAKGIVSGAAWGGNDAASYSKGNFSSSGVIALSYNYGSVCKGYVDGTLVYDASTKLQGQNMYTRFIGVGGNYVTTGNGKLAAATGMKIEAVAIFNTALSETEIAAYQWPSEKDKSLYAPFLTNFSDRIMTITSTGNANAAVDLGDAATFALFDPNAGLDTATNFTGNQNTTALPGQTVQDLAWKGWASNQGNKYSAPGLVMRFPEYVSGRSITVGGGFSPFTVGGLIVEENASSGNVVPSWTQGGTRNTELGDMRTEGSMPTYFVLRDNFVSKRQGWIKFYGDITFDIASGKSFDCNTAYSFANTLQPGAIFRVVGEGTFKVATLTATGATLDYSAQTLERMTEGSAYINGTLAVDASTTIVLPTNAVAGVAYKLATAISGDAIGALKLGDDSLPDGATVVINQAAGTIGFVVDSFEQDIDGEKLISSITWQSGNPTSSDLVTFNLATDTKLTLDASFQYMALDLNCEGNASVIVNSELTTPMTIKGVEGAKLTIAKTANAIISQQIIVEGFSEIEVQGEFGAGEITFGSVSITLVKGASIAVTSATSATFAGEGQVVFSGVAPSAAAKEIFQNAAQWTGTVWLKNLNLTNANFDMDNYGNADSKIKLTGITGYAAQASNPGVIDCSVPVELVDEDETLAVDLSNGFSNLKNQPENVCTYTFAKITGSGTFKNSGGDCSPQYRFVDVADFTGKLWVAKNMRFSIGEGEGFGKSGAIVIDGDATIGCTLEARTGISVADGVALTIPVAEGETKVMPLTVNESNTIKVSGTTGVFVYDNAKLPTFDFSEAGEIELKLIESVGWDGSVDVRFASTDAIPTVHLVRADGSTEITEVKTSTSGSTVTYQFAPQVDSSSAWYAWEFDGTLTSVGKEKATMSRDHGPFYNLESNAVYAISHPYAGVNYPSEFTASIYGTLPETNNAVLVAFGTIGGGGVALVAGDPVKQEVKMVYWPNNTAHTPLATMTVPNAFTSDHLYLFTKTVDGIKVYLDGTLVIDKKGSYSFGGGIQVGTIYEGIGNTGLGRLDNLYGTPTETNVLCNALINSLRIYDAVLGPKAIELISEELGYVSPNGSFERTLDGNANFLTGAADWTKVGEGAVDAPAQNATIELTADTASELTINVEDVFSAEALTVKGAGAVTFKRGTGILNNAGVTTISTPVTIECGALDISGNAVTILEGGSLKFDYSTFELDELPYVTTYYHATGLVNGDATPTAVNLPTLKEGWTCSFELDESTSQWGLKVVPPHEAGAVFTWASGVYPDIELTDGEKSYALDDLFPGDKIQLSGEMDYETTTTLGDTYPLVYASDWSGVLKKVGAGEATFNLGAGFTHDLVIVAGTAKMGASYGFGNYTTDTSAQARQIIVEAGAIADLNGVYDQCLAFVLNGGTLVNTGANIGDNNRQTVSITLTADSYVGGTGNFGLHGSKNAETALNLDTFTLTKIGSNAFDLVNATINGTGTLKIEEGSLRARVADSNGGTEFTLVLDEGTTFDVVSNIKVGNLVMNGTRTGNGSLRVAGALSGAGSVGAVTLVEGGYVDATKGAITASTVYPSSETLVIMCSLKGGELIKGLTLEPNPETIKLINTNGTEISTKKGRFIFKDNTLSFRPNAFLMILK